MKVVFTIITSFILAMVMIMLSMSTTIAYAVEEINETHDELVQSTDNGTNNVKEEPQELSAQEEGDNEIEEHKEDSEPKVDDDDNVSSGEKSIRERV